MRQVPKELKDAARIDGASEYRIFGLVIPLVRPAIGAIGIFTMIPIWNDLWFPLILAPSAKTATVTLGVQQFLGQFVSDWNAVLSSLDTGNDPHPDHLPDFLQTDDPQHHCWGAQINLQIQGGWNESWNCWRRFYGNYSCRRLG